MPDPITYHPVNNPEPAPVPAAGATPAPGANPAPTLSAPPEILEKEIQITQFGQPRIVNYNDKKTGQPKTFTVYYLTGNDGITYEVGFKEWLIDKKVGDVIKIKYQVVTNQGTNGQVYTNYRISVPTLAERVSKLEKQVAALGGKEVPSTPELTPTPPAPTPAPVEEKPAVLPVAEENQVENTPPKAMPF